MTDLYAVFGNPIEHSKSPVIHTAFAEQAGHDIRYEKRLVELGQFEQSARQFFQEGGKGFNITVPFKEEAYAFANQLSDRAKLAGAVNTIKLMEDGSTFGDNTDGAGLVRDITTNLAWQIQDKTVLIIGAGGAVRGVMQPLLEQKPKRVIIANRTLSKAEQLANLFASYGEVVASSFEDIPKRAVDLIINGSSASLSGELPPIPIECIDEETCCYDMMYGSELTVFLKWAQHQGAEKLADGLGMLVEQAAEAFTLWRGVRPDSQQVLQQTRMRLPSSI